MICLVKVLDVDKRVSLSRLEKLDRINDAIVIWFISVSLDVISILCSLCSRWGIEAHSCSACSHSSWKRCITWHMKFCLPLSAIGRFWKLFFEIFNPFWGYVGYHFSTKVLLNSNLFLELLEFFLEIRIIYLLFITGRLWISICCILHLKILVKQA